MDRQLKQPLRGTVNIMRFNWPLYALVFGLTITTIAAAYVLPSLKYICLISGSFIFLSTLVSLLTSWYVYDYSPLYTLPWIQQFRNTYNEVIVNITAGFDETSETIKTTLPHQYFYIFDFYDPAKHTEASIKRARKLYPAPVDTQTIQTHSIPLRDNSADKVFIIFSAHEIREEAERIRFFKELKRILKPGGQIFLTEHLRNIPNFLAYNIGYLHFYPKSVWQYTIKKAGLLTIQQQKTTPFITTFTIIKNGISS